MKDRDYIVNYQPVPNRGWCGYRFLLILSIVASVIIYTAGAIVTGIVYRSWSRQANCTQISFDEDHKEVKNQEMFDYNTPLVVIGPSFMALGAAILVFFIFQWGCCRPLVRR